MFPWYLQFSWQISSLPHSTVFLYFFALSIEEGFLISPCYVKMLHSIYQQIWKTQQQTLDCKGQFSFQSQREEVPKNVQTTRLLCTFLMLVRLCSKPFKLGFRSMWTENFQMSKLGLEKAEDQRSNHQHLLDHRENKGTPEKSIYFCFFDYTKVFDCMDHSKLWKILKEIWISDHLTYLLRNQYAGQEGTVITGYATTDWFKIGKGVQQGCIFSSCLFNLHKEYIEWNLRLDESQAGIKDAGRNINNLRYADDIPLMAESNESLLRRVKEESEKAGLKLNIQRTKIMSSGPIISWQIEG